MPIRTPLYESQKRLNAKFVDFHGWEMPIWFSSIIDEHNTVRNSVGVFDVSHMGEILVEGKDAEKFVDYILTNSVSKLKEGQIVYSPMCLNNGGIVDDLLAYKFSIDKYLLVVNASNIDKDYDWIISNSKKFNVNIKNISNSYSQIAFQGPKSQELLQQIVDIDLSEISFYEFKHANISKIKCLISRTGYTGEDGFEIYLPPENAKDIYEKLIEISKSVDGKPCGLGCRDTLRFEATYMLYGNDIDENTNPLEAGLKWTIDFDKDFIGKEKIETIKNDGLNRFLRAIEILEKKPVRPGYKILNNNNEEIGYITSAAKSPTTGKNLALGYIIKEYSKIKNEITIDAKGKKLKAIIIKKPFYKGSVKTN